MSRNTQHLQKRHNTWHVVVEIPKALRAAAGAPGRPKARFKKSLGTDSLIEANRRKHAWIAEFKRRIEALEKSAAGGDAAPALLNTALALRQELERARAEGRVFPDPLGAEGDLITEEDFVLDQIRERASDIYQGGDARSARRFYAAATGGATPLRDISTQWLAEREGQVRESVRGQQRAVIRRYLDWAGEHVTIEETDRRKAGAYVAFLLSDASGIASSTARRHVSGLSEFWQWLISRGIAETNQWRGHKLRSPSKGRPPLSDAALITLLTGTSRPHGRYYETLQDLMRLALTTGARIDELCGLRRDDALKREDGWWLCMREYPGRALKSAAAEREVPVHLSAAHVLERRTHGVDLYLFPGLKPGGPDQRRSWNVSNAFAAYRKRVGVQGRGEVFHSIRNTFVEAMEGAGVPESTVKLLIGHARTSLTFGGYSKGAQVDLRAAINKLHYSAEVMRLIAEPLEAP